MAKLKKAKYYELPRKHAKTHVREYISQGFFGRALQKRSCYCKSRSSSFSVVRMLSFETEFYEFSVALRLRK